MILVDTSTWIDFFAKRRSPHVETLISSIKDSEDICICGIILTEILQGIRDDTQHRKTKTYLGELIFLPMTYPTFVKSADIYRSLRRKGITVRKPVDCMIAAVAIEHEVSLLHNDKDFAPMEKYCNLKNALRCETMGKR
ncbi:MAG TPA: PIN domain nuclease [Candidatus Hydrogenedentes bacterium]|nr:PIN domain nuclease [Candidatus Hydrogenedentota bacterium]HIJ74180.1 PIN domain nuclease [Candidatus Hydrogenedentota bacterium]